MQRLFCILIFSFSISTIVIQTIKADDIFPDESGTIPITAWDVIPDQIIDQPFHAGVIAFHEVSVSVHFTIKSKDQTVAQLQVDSPTLNPRTGVWEFVLPIDPKQIPDGDFQVIATCTPGGQGNRAVTLEPLNLFANHAKSLGPFKTVYADADTGDDNSPGTQAKPFKTLAKAVKAAGDGGTVLLGAGEYSPHQIRAGLNRKYWTTIAPTLGTQVQDVQISSGRPGTQRLRFERITLFADKAQGKYNTIIAGENGKTQVWLDQCVMLNKQGRWKGNVNVLGNRYVSYITGGLSTQLNNGPAARLMRNHRVEHITSDAFTSVAVAINSTVVDIDRGPTSAHPDFHQSHVAKPDQFNTNRILYNVRGIDCIAQGFFGLNLKDSAFVNCLYDKVQGNYYRSQYSGKLDHVLFFHITLPNQTWLWRSNLKTRNCYILNSLFQSMGTMKGADVLGVTISDTHIMGKNSMSKTAHLTVGSPMFINAQENNFAIPTSSPAAGNAPRLQTVPADINGKARQNDKVDRGAFIAE